MVRENQELIIGVGVMKGEELQAHYSCLGKGEFADLMPLLHRTVPPHQKWFSRCWDQVMFVVLIEGALKYVMAVYECVGRERAREMLQRLRDDIQPLVLAPGGVAANAGKIEKRLRTLQTSIRGTPPPRQVLILYPGAPKKFLTKEEQEPEYLHQPQGKSRLQKALEEIDKADDDDEDDGFVFDINSRRRSTSQRGGKGKEEDSDEFMFNMTQKDGGGAAGAGGAAGPAGVVFTSPHPRVMPGGQGGPPPWAARPMKKTSSPAMSTDFTWNGARISPDTGGEDKQGSAFSPVSSRIAEGLTQAYETMASAFSADYSALRGKSLSSQFAQGSAMAAAPNTLQQGGAPDHDGKIRGAVGSIAPSGLSWEDEIASQLAAAGVRISSASEGTSDADNRIASGGRTKSMFGSRASIGGTSGIPPLQHRLGSYRQGGGGDRNLGLGGRIATRLKKTFNLQTDHDKLIG